MSINPLQKGLTALLLIAACVSVASAQQVNSEIRGSVTNTDGDAISGASVVVTHLPSGSRRESSTGDSGGFFQPGLRVGGPYTITVSADGYRDALYDQINLAPGGQRPFEIVLETVSAEIEELIVTAEAAPIQDLDNAIGSAYAADDIINMPAADRDVSAIRRRCASSSPPSRRSDTPGGRDGGRGSTRDRSR